MRCYGLVYRGLWESVEAWGRSMNRNRDHALLLLTSLLISGRVAHFLLPQFHTLSHGELCLQLHRAGSPQTRTPQAPKILASSGTIETCWDPSPAHKYSCRQLGALKLGGFRTSVAGSPGRGYDLAGEGGGPLQAEHCTSVPRPLLHGG